MGGAGAGMKTSIYINKENEERLKALLQGDKGLNTSKIINHGAACRFQQESASRHLYPSFASTAAWGPILEPS